MQYVASPGHLPFLRKVLFCSDERSDDQVLGIVRASSTRSEFVEIDIRLQELLRLLVSQFCNSIEDGEDEKDEIIVV